MMEPQVGALMKHPTFADNEDAEEKKIEVATTHDGDFSVPVYVHTPKSLVNTNNNAAIIYAHGGGAVGLSAELYRPFLATLAVECGVVVFNVEYRLAPETKCPNNIKDFYSVLKHVIANAASLGIDASKIAIAGESGGGYI